MRRSFTRAACEAGPRASRECTSPFEASPRAESAQTARPLCPPTDLESAHFRVTKRVRQPDQPGVGGAGADRRRVRGARVLERRLLDRAHRGSDGRRLVGGDPRAHHAGSAPATDPAPRDRHGRVPGGIRGSDGAVDDLGQRFRPGVHRSRARRRLPGPVRPDRVGVGKDRCAPLAGRDRDRDRRDRGRRRPQPVRPVPVRRRGPQHLREPSGEQRTLELSGRVLERRRSDRRHRHSAPRRGSAPSPATGSGERPPPRPCRHWSWPCT